MNEKPHNFVFQSFPSDCLQIGMLHCLFSRMLWGRGNRRARKMEDLTYAGNLL
jgi:hypothetical protein